jgi:hypothetical protein
VVERGDLGDHPAHADAGQVRRSLVEPSGERRGVGREIAQRVRRPLGIDGRRCPRVAQVVAHDVAPAARELLAERVGPREHRRAAREQHERRRRVPEALDPDRDPVRLDRRHHSSSTRSVSRQRPSGAGELIARELTTTERSACPDAGL